MKESPAKVGGQARLILNLGPLIYIFLFELFLFQKSIGTKELEADSLENPHLAVIAVHKAYPLDLPPSYDDVTQTKVNLEPVHEKINQQEEAEALPDKTQLQNESQA